MTRRIVTGSAILMDFDDADSPRWSATDAVLIEDGSITAIDDLAVLRRRHPEAVVTGGADSIVIPGLVNAHHHLGVTPFQLGSPDHPLELWFASRLALRDVDLELDTLYSAFEMIASGVTTVQHLHSRAAGDIDDVLAASRKILAAYERIGMRASYSFALRDQNRLVYEADELFLARLPAEIRTPMAAHFARFGLSLAHQIEVFRQLRADIGGKDRLAVQIAPSNLHWLSDAALASAAELADETGAPMHMHLLETPYQLAYARKRTGGSAMAFLERQGLAGPRLTLGHGVWMSEEDIEICAHTGTHLCHNCSSNFRLKSGVAPLNRFLAQKIPVAIGIDEAGINEDRDMFQEMRLVLNTHRAPGIESASPSAASVLRMATEHGAATTPFSGRIGKIGVGMAADLVLLDRMRLTFPYQDPRTALTDIIVHRARPGTVSEVLIDGETVYRDGIFTRIDREAILGQIAEALRAPLSDAELARRELAEAVFPHVRRFYEGYCDP